MGSLSSAFGGFTGKNFSGYCCFIIGFLKSVSLNVFKGRKFSVHKQTKLTKFF